MNTTTSNLQLSMPIMDYPQLQPTQLPTPNSLNQTQIDRTTQFFNSLDSNSDGLISIQDIIDACYNYSLSIYHPLPPNWLTQLSNIYTPESIITKDEYNSKKSPPTTLEQYQSYCPELTLDFSQIDINNDNQITFQELYDKYMSLLQKPTTYASEFFINTIKTKYNLTNESQITLTQLLEYETNHNIMRYWPI